MRIAAPAKVNLGLRVLARRADGFHEIDTVMAPIDLADEIDLGPARSGLIVLEVDPPVVDPGPDNLAWRAAQLLRERTGRTDGVRIRLVKRIPVGAGLGGGSSDAAAVLRGLVRLWGLEHDVAELMAWGAELGSDVPFFLHGGPARCRGRGERVEPADVSEGLSFVLVNPRFEVPTPWAYRAWDRWNSSLTPDASAGSVDPARVGGVLGFPLANDLEMPVFHKYPVLEMLKEDLLDAGADGAALSGSGATVFGLCGGHDAAARVARRMANHYGSRLWVGRAITSY